MRLGIGLPYMTLVAAVVIFASPSVGHGQVPKADDIAACNAEAQRAVESSKPSGDSAQPNATDHRRAAEARRSETAAPTAGGGTKSDDPQLAGMDIQGAKDPAYQAAYRTCMRRAGF